MLATEYVCKLDLIGQADWKPRATRCDQWRRVERHPLIWLRDQHHRTRYATRTFPDIERAITESRHLLELPTDWDDQGAAAIKEATWRRAAEVLRKAVAAVHRWSGLVLPPPHIGPCADGSIDLFWKAPEFTLLLNVQPVGAGESDFYCETSSGVEVKGPFHPDSTDFEFLRWLVQ